MERMNVRKGAWTEEEDVLLRQCIDKYGPGQWHQIPLKAGLNRCRKSCRLRWLNYLRPNINRGKFSSDEFDLIIRLHKLLGNRWSLIAGRLPGRTANDVKNYWTTNMRRKSRTVIFEQQQHKNHEAQKTVKVKPLKPQARIISKNITCFNIGNNIASSSTQSVEIFGEPSPTEENLLRESSLELDGEGEKGSDDGLFKFSGMEEGLVEIDQSNTEEEVTLLEAGHNCFDDFSFDMEGLWDFMQNANLNI